MQYCNRLSKNCYKCDKGVSKIRVVTSHFRIYCCLAHFCRYYMMLLRIDWIKHNCHKNTLNCSKSMLKWQSVSLQAELLHAISQCRIAAIKLCILECNPLQCFSTFNTGIQHKIGIKINKMIIGSTRNTISRHPNVPRHPGWESLIHCIESLFF